MPLYLVLPRAFESSVVLSPEPLELARMSGDSNLPDRSAPGLHRWRCDIVQTVVRQDYQAWSMLDLHERPGNSGGDRFRDPGNGLGGHL